MDIIVNMMGGTHPEKGDDGSLLLFAEQDFDIEKGKPVEVKFGLSLGIPQGYVGLMIGCKEMSYTILNNSYIVGGTKELGCVIIETRNDVKHIQKGENIAKIVFLPIADINIVDIDTP